MSELSDYKRCISDPLEAELRARNAKAASRIAELEAKLATAVGALEPFAKAFWTLSHRWQDHEDHWQSALHRKLNVGELRAAATAYRDASIQERT